MKTDNKKLVERLKMLNSLLEDYLDNLDMSEVDEDEKDCKKSKKEED